MKSEEWEKCMLTIVGVVVGFLCGAFMLLIAVRVLTYWRYDYASPQQRELEAVEGVPSFALGPKPGVSYYYCPICDMGIERSENGEEIVEGVCPDCPQCEGPTQEATYEVFCNSKRVWSQ